MFTSLTDARETLERVALEFDASALSGDSARQAVDELGLIRRLCDGMLAKAAKRVADRAGTGDPKGAAFLARSLGVPPGEIRAAIDTATRLEQLPATDRAVRQGRLAAGQARMIAETAAKNPGAELELLAAAERGLVPLRDACVAARAQVEDAGERSRRQHRQRECRMWTDHDGMVAGRFRLTPEVGGQVKAAIDAQVRRIFREHKGNDHEPHAAYAADALAAFVVRGGDATTRRDPNATVHVVIDHGALMRGGTTGSEVCEIPGVGPVNIEWVRELLGSAFLTAIVKRGKDILTVAHLGRHIPAEIQTALLVSGRECRIEGCYQRGYLERDHTHDYAKGGLTALWNLKWLCSRDHHLKSRWVMGPPNPITGKCVLRPPPRC